MEILNSFPTALKEGDPDDGDDGRRLRGIMIAGLAAIKKGKLGYVVPSQSHSGSYIVNLDDDDPYCSCPDFEKRKQACKHVYSVYCLIQREEMPDGSIKETTKAVSVKYTQDWASYDAAQMYEGQYFATLLRSLCDTVKQPERPPRRGRPYLPLSDVLYGIGVKVYSEKSGRRAMSDIWNAKAQGLLGKAPSFATVARYLKNPDLTPLLQSMITASALPLRELETHFAQDGTGFSATGYNKWHEEKWGGEGKEVKKKKKWAKAHLTVGVKTHIVVKADVTPNPSGDAPYLIPHLDTVKEHFNVSEYSADRAYLSKDNLEAIDNAGAKALIPFKVNSVPHLVMDEGDEVWNRLLAYFTFNRADFDKRYHQRSNVEAAIGAVKAKLGERLLCTSDMGMVNEVLVKVLAYNITALVHAMYKLEVEPVFDDLLSSVGVGETPLMLT